MTATEERRLVLLQRLQCLMRDNSIRDQINTVLDELEAMEERNRFLMDLGRQAEAAGMVSYVQILNPKIPTPTI